MDGQTATRTLRSRGCLLPIVALTANAMKGFERELESAGFSGYLTKPIQVDALLRDLAERLGGYPQEVAPPIVPVSGLPEAVQAEHHPDSTPIVSTLAGNPKLNRIVARFVDQLPAKLAEMDACAQRDDAVELAALAHWLKGAGGSMGFQQFFEPSKALEDAVKSGDQQVIGSIISELHRIEARILQGAQTPVSLSKEVA